MIFDDMFDVARRAAESESVSAQLPGRENGPADAYRHILWVAEMTRRFGESTARDIAGLNEELSDAVEDENSLAPVTAMDRWNNDPSQIRGGFLMGAFRAWSRCWVLPRTPS